MDAAGSQRHTAGDGRPGVDPPLPHAVDRPLGDTVACSQRLARHLVSALRDD